MKKKIANYILSKMLIVYLLGLALILFVSDIFSCSDNLDIKKIKEILSQYFVINTSSIKMIERTISKL